MSKTIEFRTYPPFIDSDFKCRIRQPYPAKVRRDNWCEMLRKVMNTLDDAQRHSAQALIEPTFLDAMCTGYIIPAPIDVEGDEYARRRTTTFGSSVDRTDISGRYVYRLHHSGTH